MKHFSQLGINVEFQYLLCGSVKMQQKPIKASLFSFFFGTKIFFLLLFQIKVLVHDAWITLRALSIDDILAAFIPFLETNT